MGGGNECEVGATYGIQVPSFNIKCYNPVKNSWKSLINTPYRHFAMTTLNKKLIIAGGVDKSDQRTNEVFKIDSGSLKKYNTMITRRSRATATGYQGMLIITGGVDDKGNRLSSTELFDSTDGRWYICNDLPQPYYWLQSVIVDNILYLLGGFDKDYEASPAVFAAPLDTLSEHQLIWKICQKTPWSRSAPVSVHGTQLLIIGGYNRSEDKDTTTTDIYRLNKVDHRWDVIGQIPSGRNSSAVISTANNEIVVIGGVNDRWENTKTVWIGSNIEPQP